VTLAGSTLNALSHSGGIATQNIFAEGHSVLDFDAGRDIRFPNITAMDSDILMDAGGEIAFVLADFGRSSVDMTTHDDLDSSTAGDITFDIVEGIDTELRMIADGGGIYTLNDWSYLYLRGGYFVTLSARDDIGTLARRLIVDIPAEMGLRVLVVDNFHIDALDLAGEIKFLRRRPAKDVRGGRDEHGVNRLGDWLTGGGMQTLYPALAAQAPDALAAWLAARNGREVWSALIPDQALSALIAQREIAKSDLKALLVGGGFNTKAFNAAYAAGQYDLLAGKLRDVLNVAPPAASAKASVRYVDDARALDWLAAAIDAGLVENLGEAIHGSMTAEDLMAILDEAWRNADYQGRMDTAPADGPARAVVMTIGESFGEGRVWNAGDILILQLSGDLTAADIHSDTGDVTLATPGGSILGAASGVANVRGRYINLSAAGSIGGASQALTTEQQMNRPVLVGNIVNPPLDGAGNPVINPDGGYDFLLVARPVLNVAGLPALDDRLRPILEWTVCVQIGYDWLRVEYPGEATRLDAVSGADIFIHELKGDMGVGSLTAAGDVGLSAAGSILDVRAAGEAMLNIAAGGDVRLSAASGTIGTRENYLDIDVDGVVTADASGDISIAHAADMILVADSRNGQVNADAAGDLDLSNTAGDLVIGPIYAGADITITAQGSILPGDRLGRDAQVKGRSIALSALGGTAGTAAAPLDVDTDAPGGGTLSIFAASTVFVRELTGDLRLERLVSGGDATLIIPDNLIDAANPLWNDAAAMYLASFEAFDRFTALSTIAEVLRGYADRLWEKLDAASEKVNVLGSALADLMARISDLERQIADMDGDPSRAARLKKLKAKQSALAAQAASLTGRLNEALQRQAAAQAAFDQADRQADIAEGEAAAQHGVVTDSVAEMVRRIRGAIGRDTVEVAGNLLLRAGGSIGEADHALSMLVSGTVTVDQGDNPSDGLYIASGGPITFSGINAYGNVGIIALGDIRFAPGRGLSAEVASLLSLNGDVGSKKRPVLVNAGEVSAAGNNVYLRSARNLRVDTIIAGNEARIRSDGGVTGVLRDAGDDRTHFSAPMLDIEAGGNVGAASNPLRLNVDRLKLLAGNVTLANISGALDIVRLRGNRVRIDALGGVLGGPIYADRLTIRAGGSVATKDDPLILWVPGDVRITSVFGRVYYINRYRPAVKDAVRVLYLMRFPVTVFADGQPRTLALYIAATRGVDGSVTMRGAWLLAEERAADFAGLIRQIAAQGVANPAFIFAQPLPGLAQALRSAYPGAVVQGGATMWILGALIGADAPDIEALLEDLQQILTADREAQAVRLIEAFSARWGEKYPEIAAMLSEGWTDRAEFFRMRAADRRAACDLAGFAPFLMALQAALGADGGFENENALTDALAPVLIQGIQASALEKAA
jgi:hypothetical protein